MVVDKLGLAFKNSVELNTIIDGKLPSQRPPFKKFSFILGGKVLDIYMRDVVECMKALFRDPELTSYLKYSPERHYSDELCTIQLFHDMHTGDWWWETQVSTH
jgi:hypothetical protein